MYGAFILLLFLLAFFIAVFIFSKLSIKIYSCLDGVNFCGHIDFEIHHLKLFSLKLGRKRKHKYSVFKNREKFYKSLKKYTVRLLEVNGEIGLGDASVTALTVSGLYSVLSVLYAILFNHINVEKIAFDLKPDFSGKSFFIELLCIIDVKVVNIMFDIIKIWVDYTREKFERREEESLLWQSIR